MGAANPAMAEIPVPAIRQDLRLLPSILERSGQPSWLLYDPARNRYFKMGKRAFEIFHHWQPGLPLAVQIELLHRRGIDATMEEISTLVHFLRSNDLSAVSSGHDIERMVDSAVRSRKAIWKTILHNYLFFRIPLFKPDKFLENSLPWLAPLFGRWTWPVVFLFGLAGLYLASRQWSEFKTTFLYFFDLRGMIIFGLTTILVKSLHELGHAFTAKSFGCRVPIMGVAFMALYPMLYTDTTDAWRLSDSRQRLRIAMAGMKVELAAGSFALFVWGFMDDGPTRSAMWFLASVSWLSSIAVNLSPLMRFDGYYILSDWLGEENLQPRAFRLARWHLRRMLFGIHDPSPEILPERRHYLFIGYAWIVWIYRLFVFFGIALMVYHFAFKALGLVLFAIEIGWFIILPIWHEIHTWWQKRTAMHGSVRPFILFFLLLAGVLFLFVPWQSQLVLPAVWKSSQHSLLFPPESGQLRALLVENDQIVDRGQPVFEVSVPDIPYQEHSLAIDRDLLNTLFERHPGSIRELKILSVLKMRRIELLTRAKAFQERKDRLLVKAPFSGRVEIPESRYPGEWLAGDAPLLSITEQGAGHIVAYVQESQLNRIDLHATGTFVAMEGLLQPISIRIVDVSNAAVAELQDPILASVNGGPVAVRQLDAAVLRPEKGLYRIQFEVASNSLPCDRIMAGVIRLNCQRASFFQRIWYTTVSVLIRELSF